MFNVLKAGIVPVFTFIAVHLTNAQVKPLDFKEYDMPNGMHVILHEDHSAPVVATVVQYKVGSRDEDPQRTGFAHFFEHLMFESTEMIERHTMDKLVTGAGGQLNAFTSNDETVYHFVVPSTEVRLALWIEAQRMRKLQVNAIGVETQRGVVKEERKNRYDNAPYGGWYEKMQSHLFRDSPYAWAPIGSSQHIDSASIDEFKEFYNKYYQPNNAILVVSGDFDEQLVRETINVYFGSYSQAPEPSRPQFTGMSDSVVAVKETINDLKARLPALFMGYRSVGVSDTDAYAIELLSTIMSQGESSRFYKSVVDSQQVAVNVSLSNQFREYAGMTYIVGIASPGNSLDAVTQSIDVQLNKVLTEGVTEAELQKAKNITEAQFVGSRTGMYNKALQLASFYRYFHDTGLINREFERYMKITREDIQRVAKRLFENRNRVLFYYLPSRG